MTAMSGSMAPDIPPSRIAASHPVDADTFKTADVIAYHPADNIAGGHTSGPCWRTHQLGHRAGDQLSPGPCGETGTDHCKMTYYILYISLYTHLDQADHWPCL
jgi:hypothetical protein